MIPAFSSLLKVVSRMDSESDFRLALGFAGPPAAGEDIKLFGGRLPSRSPGTEVLNNKSFIKGKLLNEI